MTQPALFYQCFTHNKNPITSGVVTVNVYRIEKSTGTVTQIITNQTATEIGNGIYFYRISNADDITDYDFAASMAIAGNADEYIKYSFTNQNNTSISSAVWERSLSGYSQPQAGYYLLKLANNQVSLLQYYDPQEKTITVVYGDDYLSSNGRAISVTSNYVLTGNTVNLIVKNDSQVYTIPCTIVSASLLNIELTSTQVNNIGIGNWDFDLEITTASNKKITEIQGKLLVLKDVR
jgi:hypothetical protein